MFVCEGQRHLQLPAGGIRGAGIVARCAGQDTDIGGYVNAPLQIQVDTGFPLVALLVGVVVGSAGLNPRVTARTARVTYDIEQEHIGLGGTQGVLQHFLTGNESANNLSLHDITFLLKRSCDGTECHVACVGYIQVIHRQHKPALALPIQIIRYAAASVLQAVMNQHLATAHRHTVARA